MTIDKAIEVLSDLLGEGPQFPPDDRRDAAKLGIEALKQVLKDREKSEDSPEHLLPGEILT